MNRTSLQTFRRSFAIVLAAAALAACADDTPLAPATDGDPELAPQFAKQPPQAELRKIVTTLRRATDRYHRLEVALADGFVHVHDCEVRPGEGPVGTVYAHPGRMFDGKISLKLPDALIYEPMKNGRLRLVGVELVMPYSLWTKEAPPKFMGHTFEREDEFGIFGLHVWVWRENPNGLFAPANPRVSCLED